MNAKEARAAATLHKKQVDDNKKIAADKTKTVDTALLYKHMCDKIEASVNAGHLTTKAAGQIIEFSADRWPDSVISDVVTQLRQEGYNVVKDTHLAFNKIKFEISWVN